MSGTPVPHDPEPQPWDRTAGETPLWFERFDRYRLMGHGRSVLAVYNEERRKEGKKGANRSPGSWLIHASQFQWTARAIVWDEEEATRRRVELEEEAESERQQRRMLLRASRQLLAREIMSRVNDPAKVAEMPMRSLIEAMAIVMREQRTEYGEASVITRTEQVGKDGGAIQIEQSSNVQIDLDQLWMKLSIEQCRQLNEIIKSLDEDEYGAS